MNSRIVIVACLPLLGSNNLIFSQDGQFDLRFNIFDVSCSKNTLLVDVEIMTEPVGTIFYLANPRIFQELTLSNIVSSPNSTSLSFYGTPTNTDSDDRVVSYNIELLSSANERGKIWNNRNRTIQFQYLFC